MNTKLGEVQQHQTYILNNIHQVLSQTNGVNGDDFRKNEMLKEQISSQLQEIGQAAYEIRNIINGDDSITNDKSIYEKLSILRNTRYHQEAEHAVIGGVWNIVKNDIPEFERMLKEDMQA